nr:phospholipase-like protein [Tanacetum cinerariifolium]
RQIEVLGDENDVVPLKYDIVENFKMQFVREEFCLVSGLKFEVEYWADYNDEDEPIPFRLSVIFRCLCCVGILQLVLLGVEDRRAIPDWILRLANDRDGWDKYPWGSYVWPTLYSQLKNANVKRWPSLYATQPIDEVDKKTYLIFEFTWAFKILESFRGWAEEYYTRHKRHHRVVALSSNGRFFRDMVFPFFHMMKKGEDMYEKMSRFMKGMTVGSVRQAKPDPIIVSQHYGLSDFSGFQSNQGGSSTFQTPKNSSFYEVGQAGGKSKNKGKKASVSPFNLGNAYNDEDVEGDDNRGTRYCHSLEPTYPDGWLSGDRMNAWIQLLIRERPKNSNWTLSKSGTVYMPINTEGNHWVTGAINLTHSVFLCV